MTELFLDDRVTLHCGDCLDVLATLAECSLDSCVTDAPYHLTSIVKRFGAENAAPAKFGTDGVYARASSGFMGKVWDGGDIAFRPEVWAQVYRVLKPGAYLLAFGGTRTYHRMACAIEDAGFEVRDMLSWLHGQGFPKSLDISKQLDKAAGAKGTFGEAKSARHQGYIDTGTMRGDEGHDGWQRPWMDDPEAVANAGRKYIPATDAAREWEGWGTALKPALEPICMARKPLSEDTVAANVLKHGTGAINIDGCRVGETKRVPGSLSATPNNVYGAGIGSHAQDGTESGHNPDIGRWPANVITDGSEQVTAAFPETASGSGDKHGHKPSSFCASTDWEAHKGTSIGGDTGSAARFFYQAKPDDDNGREGEPSADRRYTDEGATDFAALPGMRRDAVEPSRLFYTAKADKADRLGSKHPTVKPVNLLQYLVRLVTPPGGVCLDPFAGTGTTGEAAWREGMRAVLIEREEEYQTDIRRRMALAFAGPMVRKHESVKAKTKDKPVDHGPLFRFGAEDE